MAQREKNGRVVFVGNIPFGTSEEVIMDIFGRCGQVMGFRLVYDKDTGQPKGFGFLEYANTDDAASAVRNLNEHELNGRTLRVDYSNDNRGVSNQTQQDGGRAPLPAHMNMNTQPDPAALPPLPPGVDLPAGVTALDAISQTLRQVPTPQLLDFISQLKNLCSSNPPQATALLQQAPQLSYAVFQAMCLLGLVDPTIVGKLVSTAAPVQQAPPPQQLPLQMAYQPPPQQLPTHLQYAQYGAPPNPYAQPYAPTPPQHQAYQPPPQPQPAPQPEFNDQAALIRQVLALTREQIYAMEPSARDQIMALRAQYGAPV